MSDNCIFCKIVQGELPCSKVYEDDDMIAFHDIKPVAPVHLLVIPKLHIASLEDAGESHTALLGKMLLAVPILAHEQGLKNGFRTAIHTGKEGGQIVFHLHIHIVGGGNIRHDAVTQLT
jgi:histidine triad (HIT) family protein